LVNRERAHFAAVGTYRRIERNRSIEHCHSPNETAQFVKIFTTVANIYHRDGKYLPPRW
jgi:hypothetical protein